MTKNLAALVNYQEQTPACNRRDLDALAVVDDPTPADHDLRRLTEPMVVAGRSDAGFNPARCDDARLFQAVLDGSHIARGYCNADIREPHNGVPVRPWGVYGNDCTSATLWPRSRAHAAGE